MPTIIDLSHRIEPGMPAYPGLPEPRLDTFLAHGDADRQSHYAPGTTFQIATYSLGGNTGTYVDAPFHRHPRGADLAELALDKLADVPAVRVVALEEGPIGTDAFRGLELAGKAVLIRTDWADRWRQPDYFRSGPFLTADTCRFLVRSQVALVGIDCANIDNMTDPERPAHTILLAAGIPIVEHLRGLDELPPGGFRFFAVPPAIVGGTSFPVRAFAIVGSLDFM
jgi:kynurenine formamidase